MSVTESVMIGSIYLALKHNYVSYTDVLEWLAINLVTERSIVAYVAVCDAIHPDHHVLGDGTHLYDNVWEYFYVGVLKGLTVRKFPNEMNKVREVAQWIKDTAIMICDSKPSVVVIREVHNSVASIARLQPIAFTTATTTQQDNDLLLDSDHFELLTFDNTLAQSIVNRVMLLSANAPGYLSLVKDYYDAIARDLVDFYYLSEMQTQQLVLFSALFPGIIDHDWNGMSNIRKNSLLMDRITIGYILGFPVHEWEPTSKEIRCAVEDLEKIGFERYCDKIYNSNATQTKNIVDSYGCVIGNEEDVVCEDPESYSPLDIVRYKMGKHLFRFTMTEFDNLSKKNLNHWTGEPLPRAIMVQISVRIYFHEKMDIESTVVFKELLRSHM